MTTILPPNPPPSAAPSPDDGRARERVIRARGTTGNGNGPRTTRLPTNGHATTRLQNGQHAPVQNPKSKFQNRHKPLFVLRHPAPRYRVARRRKGGGMLRTILAGVGSAF